MTDKKNKISSNLVLCDVPVLMAKYFQNKDERKQIKVERMEYLSKNECKIKGKTYHTEEGEYGQMADCLQEPIEVDKYCDTCKARHNFYLRLKKLQGENTGIMLKVRSAVARNIA